LSSSGFDVIRKHARDAASIRIKELAQELARVRSQNNDSRLETDDVRSQGRMDHSTIKLNDERLKFGTTLPSANTDFFYELPIEPDLDKLKVWLMMDHLGSKIRDMSGFNNDAIVAGHPTLRRATLDLGFQQQSSSPATPAMLFNSGTDVVSATNGEYIWIPDNNSIKFTQFTAGFSLTLRFNCLDFLAHELLGGGTAVRRIAAKSDKLVVGDDVDNPIDGWNLIANAASNGTNRGIVFQVVQNGLEYKKRVTGLNVDQWYQLIVTYDKNPLLAADQKIKMYVDGVLSGSVDTTTTLFLPTHPNLRIGARDAISGFFRGYIHDFRVYMDKVLNQTEITNLNTNEMTIDNIPKGRVFIVQYAMINQSMVSKTHKYHITGKVTKTKRHRFNVLKKVTRSKTHKFTILIKALKTKTHKFSILNKVTMSKTHKFSMGGTVRLQKTHKYNILQKITTTKTHRYAIGGLQTQYQRFTKSTTAGSNITQAITFTSTPQALIVWSDGNLSDNTFTNDVGLYYGFSDGTHHACVSGSSQDGQTTTDTFSNHKDNRVIVIGNEPNPATTPLAEATVSFSGNQAIFNWTTNDNRAVYINCMALWGINKAEVKSFTAGTGTGVRTFNLNDATMTPTFIHTIATSSATGTGWLDLNNGLSISIGAAKSSTKQFCTMNVSEDGRSPSDCYSGIATDAVIYNGDDDDGSVDWKASLSSFGAGNFALNVLTDPGESSRPFSVLALDATGIDVGNFIQPNNVLGNQTISTATNVGQARGLMIFNNGTENSSTSSRMRLIVGGGSGSGAAEQGLIAVGETDAASTTETARKSKTGSITLSFTPNVTASSSTTQIEASLSSLGTNQFNLNWTTITANARILHYIVWGAG
jgi:hypothetical protein